MLKDPKILLLNLPSPPGMRLWRDDAGGFGVAIRLPKKFEKADETTLHPFLPYASALLSEAGYEFKAVDLQRLKLHDHDKVLSVVEKENPNIIFSVISLPSMMNDLKILGKIKQSLQNVIVVGVGTVCRIIPHEVLLKKVVDVALRSDFPHVSNMIEVVKAFQKSQNLKKVNGISYMKNGEIFNTPDATETDINDLPQPCYDRIPLDGYEKFTDISGESFPYVSILDSKGCPYNCIYCPYPLGYGNKWAFRSPAKIVDEIEQLYNLRGVRGFAFRGQAFAYNKKQAMKICDEIIRRKLDVAWICESRVNEISNELITKMRKAGCRRIHYGVETGDPETLKIAKPGVSLKTTERAFEITRRNSILTQAHMILGWPEDNDKTLANTHRFILKLNPDVLNINFLTPYPGTKMYQVAKQNGLILTNDWSNYTSHTVVMRTKNLSANELRAYRNKIIRDFAKQKLQQILIKDGLSAFKKPKAFISEAKSLVTKILFPYN